MSLMESLSMLIRALVELIRVLIGLCSTIMGYGFVYISIVTIPKRFYKFVFDFLIRIGVGKPEWYDVLSSTITGGFMSLLTFRCIEWLFQYRMDPYQWMSITLLFTISFSGSKKQAQSEARIEDKLDDIIKRLDNIEGM